jgi:hypothetical protein
MILELKQPELALSAGLEAVGEALVAVLESLAAGDPVDVALARWNVGRRPRKARFQPIADLAPADRRALYEAVKADFGFDAGFRDPHFEFRYPGLPDPAKQAAKDLFNWLYSARFGETGFTVNGIEVTRASWETSFRDANPWLKVCPACVTATLPEPIQRHSFVDADHYLPKSRHPLLGIHGLNLTPVCQPCNRFKGNADPLGDDEPPYRLDQVWFPYRRPAVDEVRFAFYPAEPGKVQVGVDGAADAIERAERYDKVFAIFERWSRKLVEIGGGLPEKLIEACGDGPVDERSIRFELEKLSRMARVDRTVRDGELIAYDYYRWLLDTPTAFRALVAEVEASIAA